MKWLVSFQFMISVCYGDRDWCDLTCGEQSAPVKNTMCTYKAETSIGGCTNIQDSQTPSGRKDILDMHNTYRDAIARGNKSGWPSAANMRQMSWDSQIEEIALRWGQQCVTGHDKCRRTEKFLYVGQNYGMEGNSVEYPSSKGSFDGWVDEIRLVENPSSLITNFKGGQWGHFSQVIWANSHKLGCGEVHLDEEGFKKTILICNYAPGGNILGTEIYEKGEPCSKCPKKTRCKSGSSYPHLCSTATDDTAPVEIHSAGSILPCCELLIIIGIAIILLKPINVN